MPGGSLTSLRGGRIAAPSRHGLPAATWWTWLSKPAVFRPSAATLAAKRACGRGAAAVGRIVHVENQAYEIAGVLPAGFQFPEKADIWLAGPAKPENLNRTAYNYYAVAKLRPDVTLEAAQAQLDTIAARLEAAYPDSNRDKTFAAIPLQERLVGGVRPTLYLLLGAVALVLLIACANV